MKTKKEKRSSKWAFLMYEDSAPKNCFEILDGLHVPYIVSPKHNLDVNSETGELKKPHWHGCLFFDSLKSYSQVSELISPLNGPKHVEVVHSPKGMFDYFTHAENPDKTPYDVDDIKSGCGFDLGKFLSEQNEDEFIAKAIDIIEDDNFVEFRDLTEYARNNDMKLLRLIIGRAYFFVKYLDSRRNSMIKNQDNEK